MAFVAGTAIAEVASKMNEFAVPVSNEKTLGMPTVPHPNERVELAIPILDCRGKLRRAASDDATAEKINAEIKRLEQKLREIDE